MPTSVAIVAISSIIIVFGFAAYSQRLKHKSKQLEDTNLEQLHNEIDALKQRIIVLEKLVTDPKADLKKEIDGL